jgi:hypothetical protein
MGGAALGLALIFGLPLLAFVLVQGWRDFGPRR